MNYDEAVKAHSSWKVKLVNYLKNPDNSLKSDDICKDNLCDLGKWIYSMENKFSGNNNFKKLKSIHADFHTEAGNIALRIHSGEKFSEDEIIGKNSKFNILSQQVIASLMAIQHLLV
nr:hypothetical protein GTC16762_28420 [Pigmentibacter ruber]